MNTKQTTKQTSDAVTPNGQSGTTSPTGGNGVGHVDRKCVETLRALAATDGHPFAPCAAWSDAQFVTVLSRGYRVREDGSPWCKIMGPKAAVARFTWLHETEGAFSPNGPARHVSDQSVPSPGPVKPTPTRKPRATRKVTASK